MSNTLDVEFEATLKALEASFHVRSISTFSPDLEYAPADENAAEWLDTNFPEFDQFPVRDGTSTIGILERNGPVGRKSVREAMHPLRDGLVVSADMPIADLIPQLRDSHFR